VSGNYWKNRLLYA